MTEAHGDVPFPPAYLGRAWNAHVRRHRTVGVYYGAGALVGRSTHLAPVASWFGAGIMIFFWLAALGATIVTAILVGLVYLFSRKQRPNLRDLLPWAAALWIFNLILDLIILYYVLPPMTGPYWGGQWLIWPLILSGVFALFGGGFRQIRATVDSLTERINAEGAIRRGGKGSRDWVDERPSKSASTSRIRVGAQVGVTAIVIGLLFATVVNGLIIVGTTWFDGNA